jgi:hypothetical protein
MMMLFLTNRAFFHRDPAEEDAVFNGALNETAVGEHGVFSPQRFRRTAR